MDVVFDESEPFENMVTLQTWDNTLDMPKLNYGETFYTISDESSHLWLDSTGKVAYVVDVGCPAFLNGLHTVIENADQVE